MKLPDRLKTISACFISIIFLFVSSCKPGERSSTQESVPGEDDQPKEEIIAEITGYPLPTSFEITNMLNEAGAPYILSISNPASNADKYFTQAEKALNLGVYGADLSYASTYMMKQETILYLNATKQLTDEMEISSVFNTDYASRVENNLENRDSLISIISDSFVDTYKYLTNNNKDKLAILVMTGSWIEGLFITIQIAITAEDNDQILAIISHQESSLKKLLEILDPVATDPDAAEIVTGLIELEGHFDTIEGEITDQLLEAMSVSIENLRNKVI
ncbi:MAG: hypothetical protein JSV24_08555 [Bacteroidales bacterium]|nr:MAG: hypothetical protein JSV24_08555 [Bacteroidales bacterium]